MVVIVNENKINLLAALIGILVILVAAAAFSKFLVYDRIMEVSRADLKKNTWKTRTLRFFLQATQPTVFRRNSGRL